MNITKKMETEINKQINAELYSSYLYLSMAANFEALNMKGFGHWLKLQAKEEFGHAMRLFDYIFERGGSVTLSAIEIPPSAWKSALVAFESALEHEQKVTEMINGLMIVARAEKDEASLVFLQWFVTEQVEEEASASYVVSMLKSVGDSNMGLVMVDRELAKRGQK